MQIFFMILLIILSVSLIITVTLQPRQIQIFSSDATSNMGRTSYWASQTLLKGLTLGLSSALFVVLLVMMVISYH